MIDSKKENATVQGGISDAAGVRAKATTQNKVVNCGTHHINRFRRRLEANGLRLRGTATDTQLVTLPKVLAFLGEDGINTYEAVGAGYLRIATRIKDLEDVWEIESRRENVIGPDGLFHKGVARYILRGRKEKSAELNQFDLELEVTP